MRNTADSQCNRSAAIGVSSGLSRRRGACSFSGSFAAFDSRQVMYLSLIIAHGVAWLVPQNTDFGIIASLAISCFTLSDY